MIHLIAGKKGSGKTKVLIQMANDAANRSKGNVVLIEKGRKLTYDVDHSVRLMDTDTYEISGFDAFYGFISGVCAANYDLTDIFIDGTRKIGGYDFDAFAAFAAKVKLLAERTNTNIVFSISAEPEELTEIGAEIIRP